MQKRFNHSSNIECYFDRNGDDVLLEPIIDDIHGERSRARLWLFKHGSELCHTQRTSRSNLACIQVAKSSRSRQGPSHSHLHSPYGTPARDTTKVKASGTITFIQNRYDDDMDVFLADMDRSYPFHEQIKKLDCLTTFTKSMSLLLNLLSLISFAGHNQCAKTIPIS